MTTSSFYTDGGPNTGIEVAGPSSSAFYVDSDAAANSATQAAASAAAALASQSDAAARAADASSSATSASASATSAANSATAASGSASAAATSATNASNSATAAAGSATAAATSATNAANSATAASGSASAAAASATSASTSATNASNSATAAAGSASAAATSASNAAAAVQAAAGTATPLVDGTAAVGTGTKWAHEDHRHPTDTSRADAAATTAALALKAPLASPAFTGTPTAPTPAYGDNSTNLATTAWVQANAAPPSLIDKFRGGTVSAELFTLANGVNEFDLIKVGGTYYFAYDDKTTTQLRSASTVAGLSSASDTAPVANLRYPSIQFDGTTWHLWGQNNTTSTISHYTASSFAGTYTLSDSMPSQFGDVNVRKFSNGKWYMACLDGRDSTRPAMTFVSNSASGPWTNMGQVFKDIGRGAPIAGECDDEHIFEVDGKVYLAFGGWDGIDSMAGQLPVICELDPHTLRAKTQPVTLVTAQQAWHFRNSSSKLFNPIFLRESGVPDRIYYSHNVSTTGVAAGWGYIDIDIGTAPSDNRRDMQLMNVDFRNSNFDLATGRIPTLHGSTTVNSSGLTLTSSTGGAYGCTFLPNVDDFALCVDFTINTLPGASTYQRVFRSAKRTEDTNLISLWVGASAGGVVTMYSQVWTTFSAWTTVLTTGTRYRVMLARQNGAVLGYVNGKDEYSATISGVQTLEEWNVGNSKGAVNAAGQQFIGVIRQAVFVSGKLYDTDFPG